MASRVVEELTRLSTTSSKSIHTKTETKPETETEDKTKNESILHAPRTQILGELVGATNLVAALRGQKEIGSFIQPKNDLINAFCDVYWGDILLHRTKTISKNNNPIWACDTGSLFKIGIGSDAKDKELKIEVFDRVGKHKKTLGVVIIPGLRILNGSICNEKRMQFEIHKDRTDILGKDGKENVMKSVLWKAFNSVTPNALNPWVEDIIPQDHEEVDDDDSIYGNGGKTVATFGPSNINDDYIYGKMGTLAIRFRIATEEDLSFLKAVDIYNQGFRYAKKKSKQALASVKHILDGKMLAQLVSETSTSYQETLNCELLNDLIEFRFRGQFVDADGVNRLRVKPGPDPERPELETKFLSEPEMLQKCYEPTRNWVESGSGSLGQVKVEIMSCHGLANKEVGQIFGNKPDPFVCLIYEDCLVETDIISDCLNPMWMPWTQRAFIFNRMYSLSSIYIGLSNHTLGPMHHKGCGRIAIDLRAFEPNTVYTLKYELFSSPILTTRKKKGNITIRLQMINNAKTDTIMSILTPPVIHVNVKRRKTLAIARYTCQGNHREEVYNMKILKAYIDELMEYSGDIVFEANRGIKSLILWRGQVQIFNVYLPLHSFLVYVSAMYIIERPYLIPAYTFFCAAWCMLILMNRKNTHPSPWHRSESFYHHLRETTPLISKVKSKGINIVTGEGFAGMKKMEEERKRVMEEDKMLQSKIAKVRSELQQILAAISTVDLVTNDNGGGLNPLSKLLPVQLILRDIIYYARWVKMVVCCDESRLSFLVTAFLLTVSAVLFLLPITKMIHWGCRIFIWFVLGPWMRLIDMACKKKKSNGKMQKHVQKVMNEIQVREKKRWIDGRILREEALKLKATRILRFGRFALRIPSFNITRFRDFPLPESTARPITKGELDHGSITVKTYVPGQKHYGTMIPKLTKPEQLRKAEQRKRVNTLAHFFQNTARKGEYRTNEMPHTDPGVDLVLQDSFGSQGGCLLDDRDKAVHWQEIVNDDSSSDADSTKKDIRVSRKKDDSSRQILDERSDIYIDMSKRSIEGEREGTFLEGERNQLSDLTSSLQTRENLGMQVIASMSELTQ